MVLMEIKLCSGASSEIWDNLVLSEKSGTIFHTWKFLKIIEKNTDSVLYPLMIYKGEELKAIYPFFLMKKGGINIAMSPPSRSFLFYLGPVFENYDSLKQRKKESLFMNVQQVFDNYLYSELGCKYARIRLSPGLFDSRPLIWAGYNISSLYTNRIDLNPETEELWQSLDKIVRGTIKKANQNGVIIETGDREDMNYIYNSLSVRLKSQNINPSGKLHFLSDIYDEYNGRNMKIFIAKQEGERVGGIISLYYKDLFYLWIGTSKNSDNNISANESVVWESIKWAKENGFGFFENMDSGEDPRLRFFKSKFNPEPVIWYSAEKYNSDLYRHIGKLLGKTK